MLASPPDAVNKGLFPVAPFANVISFTALAVAVKMNNSFPLASLRLVVIRGEVGYLCGLLVDIVMVGVMKVVVVHVVFVVQCFCVS